MNFLANVLIAERILNLALNSFIILFMAWILARLFHQKAAPVRSGIILMAIVVLLILPILNLTSPAPGIPSFKTVLHISVSDSSHLLEETSSRVSANTKNSLLTPLPSSSSMQNYVQKIWGFLNLNQSGPHLVKIINGLGIIWILGSLILLIKLSYGILSLKKFKKDLIEIRDQRILQILKTAERSFTNRPCATVFTSRKISSPLALGLFKHLIILPHNFYNKMSTNEIKGILLHELSHIYHKDQITGILQRLAAALNWWNPFIYTLNADFSRAREEISDNHVLLENDKKEYAECLINLAERTSIISRLPVLTGLASPHFPLKDRVTNILSKERIMETKLKKSTIWTIVLVSLFILGTIGGHRLTFASAEKSVIEDLNAEDTAEVRPKPDPEPAIHPESTTNSEPPTVALHLPAPQEKTEKPEKKIKPGRKIIKPKLVKKVEPVYPDEAKKDGLEGTVVLEGVTDEKGKVVKAKILKGEHLVLNKAAITAIKQWEYEPFIINGKPIPFEFTVTMRFRLDEKDETITTDEDVNAGINVDVIELPDDVELKLIKRVEPKYPKEAIKKLTGGEVLLEALIDKEGNVIDVKVIDGKHQVLNDAAIDAVKQWKYEPYKENGIPKKVRYKVTLNFKVR
jgi:TonB family protein